MGLEKESPDKGRHGYIDTVYDRCDMVDQWKNKGLSINGTLGIHIWNKIGPFLMSYTKINSQWIRELNMNDKTIQPLKGAVRRQFAPFRLFHSFKVWQYQS